MSSLTRWVLGAQAHGRRFWLALTVVGIASADSATKAMDQKFSVPGKEGWETNVAIAERFGGTGGDSAPLVPVVTLPSGKTVDSPGVRARAARRSTSGSSARCPASRLCLLRFDRRPRFVSTDGRTTFAIVYPRPDPDAAVRRQPRRGEDGPLGVPRLPRRRRTRSRERLRRAPERQRAETAAPACCSRRCSAAWAR